MLLCHVFFFARIKSWMKAQGDEARIFGKPAHHPQKAELVKLRYFAGLTLPEAAEVLGISTPTAERHWAFARVWLFREISRKKMIVTEGGHSCPPRRLENSRSFPPSYRTAASFHHWPNVTAGSSAPHHFNYQGRGFGEESRISRRAFFHDGSVRRGSAAFRGHYGRRARVGRARIKIRADTHWQTPRERAVFTGVILTDSFISRRRFSGRLSENHQPKSCCVTRAHAGSCPQLADHHEELEGMAETSDLRLEELVLFSRRALSQHAAAQDAALHGGGAGPPDTARRAMSDKRGIDGERRWTFVHPALGAPRGRACSPAFRVVGRRQLNSAGLALADERRFGQGRAAGRHSELFYHPFLSGIVEGSRRGGQTRNQRRLVYLRHG
jgi:predicted DNA-binding protein (UPF0251 family)